DFKETAEFRVRLVLGARTYHRRRPGSRRAGFRECGPSMVGMGSKSVLPDLNRMRCRHLESALENLGPKDYNHQRVSPATLEGTGYNCIAWAAGETHKRWWPAKINRFYYYWPPHLQREELGCETLENFVRAFQWMGYEL